MYGTIEDIRVRCIPCSSALCLPLVVIDVGAETPPTWVEWREPWGPSIRMRKGIFGDQPDAYGGYINLENQISTNRKYYYS